MRIHINFNQKKKYDDSITTVVSTFLDYYLEPNYYGESFDTIAIEFLENPKPTKKLKRRILYGDIAEIEVVQTFEFDKNSITIKEFKKIFNAFVDTLKLLDDIPIKNKDFHKESFMQDIEALKNKLPKNTTELNRWRNLKKVYREIEDKIYKQRNEDIEFDKRQQAKNIKLREFFLCFETSSPFPTNEELEKIKIERRRKKILPIANIQSEFITRYIRKEMRKLKFTGQYHTVSIELSNRYEIKKSTQGISILIPFSEEEYRKVYPPYEVDLPIKSIIPNVNEKAVNIFISNLLIDALNYAKKNKIYLPIDEIIDIIKSFQNKNFSYEWYHKRREFKELGLKARLLCKLTNCCFTLNIIFLRGKNEIYRQEIHKSQPWSEAWRHYYEDIVIKNNKFIVTQLYSKKPLLSIDVKDILDKIPT